MGRAVARPRLPHASVWANNEAPRAQAVALEGAAAAARAAGASDDTIAALLREAEGAQQRAADGRQLGARLDSQRATVRRLTDKVSQAEEAATAAAARLEAARRDLGVAREALTQIEVEVAQAAPQATGSPDAPQPNATILQEVRSLLDALEQAPVPGHVGTGPKWPETLLQLMFSLRSKVQPPAPVAKLGEALEESAKHSEHSSACPEPESREERQGQGAAGDLDASSESVGDSIMEALASADEVDDAAMAEIARRMMRARRQGPY